MRSSQRQRLTKSLELLINMSNISEWEPTTVSHSELLRYSRETSRVACGASH